MQTNSRLEVPKLNIAQHVSIGNTMVLSLALFLLSTPTLLFGYTDPGSGVMIYQMLIAGLAGFGWTARKFLRRFISKSE